jgi:NADH-quinone oxidoreductase subunit H
MGILSSALLADTWSLAEIVLFYSAHPWYCLVNFVGFAVALTALLGKLEKAPFDIPEAETEVVAGVFVEYSGRLLAFLRLALSIELVAGASLLVAVFIPFGMTMGPIAGFILYLVKTVGIIALLSLLRSIFARLRIDQMVRFCWKYLVPLALLQLCLDLLLKAILAR